MLYYLWITAVGIGNDLGSEPIIEMVLSAFTVYAVIMERWLVQVV